MDLTYDAVRAALARQGLDNFLPCFQILYAMADSGVSYLAALSDLAAFEGLSWQQLHSEICYRFLKVGIDEHPETVFNELLKEVLQ